MSAKIIAAAPPNSAEAPPFTQYLHRIQRALLGRFAATTPTQRALAVEDRVAIGPKKSLLVVRCHGQRFLVATAGDTIGPVIEVVPPKPARRQRTERSA